MALPPSREGVKTEAHPGSILLVVHDFVARSDDELSLAKGDRIELIERDDDFGDGWFLGRHMTNGGTGLFPEVYTTPAPKGTLVKAAVKPTRSNNTTALAQQRPVSAASAQTGMQPLTQLTPVRTSLPSLSKDCSANMLSTQSPVMNETLSVIDEHITDMNTPRSSYVNGNNGDIMGLVYGTQPLRRLSYITGHETDEEEHELHTEDDVMAWSPERVAEYLEDHRVERAHCDVFREQEISGEVLLAMDQSSVFIKEFELGPVGRRLKTWHKIKALQDEVRRSASLGTPRSNSEYSAGATGDDASSDLSRNRTSSTAAALPRALSMSNNTRQSVDGEGRSNTFQSNPMSATGSIRSGAVSPLQTMTSISRNENTYRPSAQSIRKMNSRRHSSIDSSNSIESNMRMGHKRQPSLDRKWLLGQPKANGKPASSHGHAVSDATSQFVSRDGIVNTPSWPGDFDRGYFSSTEADNRSKPKVLQKKTSSTSATVSPVHSRSNSFLYNGGRSSVRSGRVASSDALRDPVSPLTNSTPNSYYNSMTKALHGKSRSLRTASSPQMQSKPMNNAQESVSPVVTKLDYNDRPSMNAIATSPNLGADSETSSANATPSPSSTKLPIFGGQKPKSSGLRTISDAITSREKTQATIPSPVKEGVAASPTRTGSTTPSTDTRSFDMHKADPRTSTGSGNNLMPPPTSTKRPRNRTKKLTSAYTRGLEKKTPTEQIEGCDYSGWMKKKSGSLMTTWKTRLFILRGRRLSYYYHDDDKEERGLIDISFHRVLPADNEKLTGLHATMTRAAGSPTSPKEMSTPTSAERDMKEKPPAPGEADDGLFIFKLVPPKSGLAKGVTFTKPTVHYFAVKSRQEGRLWMAALMKATIDRDEDGVVTTTYNQKTISLAKARARRERPPALKEETAADRAELDAADNSSMQGLGIGRVGEKVDLAVAGAEREKHVLEANSAATTATPTESEGLNESERENVALNAPS